VCLNCTRTGASVPDAAKPQHFRLEVEARFRDSNRSSTVLVVGFGRRLKFRARPACWVVKDLMETIRELGVFIAPVVGVMGSG
jgi:hypothetical protein